MPVPAWDIMPSLSICIFGPIRSSFAQYKIRSAYEVYVRSYYRRPPETTSQDSSDSEWIRFWNEKIERKLQVLSLSNESVFQIGDRPRLLARNFFQIFGEVILCLEKRANMNYGEAQVIRALGEFVCDPELMVLQGKGYHAFIRTEAVTHYGFCRSGRLRDICEQSGFKCKRVNYLKIGNLDYQSNRNYEW